MIATDRSANGTYTEALAHGGALLEEMQSLVRYWRPEESTPDFIRRVRQEDLVGQVTARTVSDYVRVFARRFIAFNSSGNGASNGNGPPARYLQQLICGNAPRQVFSDLAFYYTATSDLLLGDFTVLRYWPLVREGRLAISNDEARRFIWEAEQDGRIRAPWSEAVKKDMPARLLNALADFGLLGARRVGRRDVLPYRPADGTVVYLAHLLHEAGVTDASLAEQRAWALFGLERRDVWNRLENLAGDGWFVLQRAGEVVRITWRYPRLAEVVDAFAR